MTCGLTKVLIAACVKPGNDDLWWAPSGVWFLADVYHGKLFTAACGKLGNDDAWTLSGVLVVQVDFKELLSGLSWCRRAKLTGCSASPVSWPSPCPHPLPTRHPCYSPGRHNVIQERFGG